MRRLVLVGLVACGGGDRSRVDNPTVPVLADRADGEPAPAVPEAPQEPPPIAPPPEPRPEPETPRPTVEEPSEAPEAEPPPEPEPKKAPGLKVQPGDSLSKMLGRAGIGAGEVAKIAKALEPKMNPTAIQVGKRYRIELDEGGDLEAFTYNLSPTQAIVVEPKKGGGYVASETTVATTMREVTAKATVQSSLWAALTNKGYNAALVDVVVDTFAYDVDFFTATRKGDTIRMILERHEVDGQFVRYGQVLAASYTSGDETSTVLWWPKGDRYVDDKGRGVVRTLLKTPLKYARISSRFNPKRMHPVLHRVKGHHGVDYAAPEGTPVWAAAGGKIVFRGPKGGAGNLVIIQHGGGLKTLYMHLSKFRAGQKVGQKVAAKTVIGYVGSTGLATGPHLHFGVQQNGKYVDPQKVDSARGPGVPKSQRAGFNRYRDKMVGRLGEL